MSADILHHPAFGNPPVVNTVRVYHDSRKRKVTRLTKARRTGLMARRQHKEAPPAPADRSTATYKVLPALKLLNSLVKGLTFVAPADLTESECRVIEEGFLDGVAAVMGRRGGAA